MQPARDVDPPPPSENPYAGLDAREDLFTGALANAARAEHLAAALRAQVMLAGFDAMLLEEAAIAGRDVRLDDPVVRSFLAHQASTLHLTRQDVEVRLEHARILRDRLPATWAVFLAGLASERVVGAAADQSIGLPAACLPVFDQAAAALVQEQRETVVDRDLEKLRDELAPEAAIERAERRANRRHVTARPEGDGGGVLEIHGTAVDIAVAYDALRQRGIAAHGREGECRALSVLMADDAIDLILNGAAVAAGTAPTPSERAEGPSYPGERIGADSRPGRKAVRAEILVIVPATTATGASNAPATLAGMGSLDAETARALVAHTRTWTRVLVDPIDDAVLGIDSHDRHIPSGLKKLLHARTPSCTGDDCGLPGHRADIDHIVRYEHDGRTRHDNLQLLCRRSHQDKDNGTVAVRMRDDGSVEWLNTWGGRRIVKPALKVRTRRDLPEDAPF
ncbi:HNH endonuclease [uncultured Amnibacterium sp.]|uniref:HNH endonuclease n=1 Tax=uncultured Amnibacterium sp. TaxID=1631851 RepID=UPI0035CBF61D